MYQQKTFMFVIARNLCCKNASFIGYTGKLNNNFI